MTVRSPIFIFLLCSFGLSATASNLNARILGPASDAPAQSLDNTRPVRALCLAPDETVSGSFKAALLSLLGDVPNLAVYDRPEQCADARDALTLAVGDSPLASKLIPDKQVTTLKSEGFVIRLGTVDGRSVIAVRGQARKNFSKGAHLGAAFGLLSVLEKLGFSFLHPLEPVVPERLAFNPDTVEASESPGRRIRGIHLHTMHPLELTDLLNGWGMNGPEDAAGFTNMLDEWRGFLMWMLANKLNRVQWVLLSSPKWADFAESDERRRRLSTLVDIAHDFGIEVGIDVPIAMRQQNAFRLLTKKGSLDEELEEIYENIDWLMAAGFDFLASENGTTEFTHPNAKRMLAWMNGIAEHLDTRHRGKRAYMKIHVSSGQTVEDFADPVSGGPLNINHLTYYSDRRIGVMPHTVEFWGLSDPAPTYGNDDFSSMFEYMKIESKRREVIWYPETAYWCSFDIDVPLFLPIYAERRLKDLRTVARWEASGAKDADPIDGQVFFSSGWEWGYWLNDVVAARASWDPLLDIDSDAAAFEALIGKVFRNFKEAGAPLAALIADMAEKQAQQLIIGANDRSGAGFKGHLTGQAYLQGEDALDDLARKLSRFPMVALTPTQPNRADIFYGQDTDSSDLGRLHPLLKEMETDYKNIARKFSKTINSPSRAHRKILQELSLSLKVTALRATQARALLDYAAAKRESASAENLKRIALESRKAVRRAQALVRKAELLYRVEPDRIAAWRDNPTAYRFGYLWSVRSLYYWHRDHQRTVPHRKHPCFANVVDPVELAFGVPSDGPQLAFVRRLSELVFGRQVTNACLTASEFSPSR